MNPRTNRSSIMKLRNQVFSKNLVSDAPNQSSAQPSFSDIGLYECAACGRMVIRYEKEVHTE
jgi:hypothetical protein